MTGSVITGVLADPPAWLLYAISELGQLEAAGDTDNPRVRWYHGATGAGEEPDSVPWCSSFVNRMFACADIVGTRSKAARSWRTWGDALERPRLGCVCVISRGPDKYHVALWMGEDMTGVYLLGGNQQNGVNVTRYPRSKVVAYRWPKA